MTEKPTLEQKVGGALRSVLEPLALGSDIAESADLQRLLLGLEYFLPSILGEIYPHWKYESLDGVFLAKATKTGQASAELRGVCILISDQSITPFHLRLGASLSDDSIAWMECRIGRRGSGKGEMDRTPWSRWHGHSYSFLQDSLKPTDWAYKVGFGDELQP